MLTVALVEDDEPATAWLHRCLDDYMDKTKARIEITDFREPTALVEPYRIRYDLIFMDIDLPNMNGLEAARRIRHMDQKVIIIFVTNMAQYAVKGYEVSALDYIVKPFTKEDFNRKMDRAVSLCRQQADTITIRYRSKGQRIFLRDLAYIEVRRHQLDFHTDKGLIHGVGSLQEVEDMLQGHGFIRSSKSFLVNQRYIRLVKGEEVTLLNGSVLTIGRVYRKTFMAQLVTCIGNDHVI